jgi:conjugal transfer/entry exclusion protein
MGKPKIDEPVKELQRMSKRMARVANLMNNLSHIDDRFEKKADELMGASVICDTWADDIFDEYLKEKVNEEKYKEVIEASKEN